MDKGPTDRLRAARQRALESADAMSAEEDAKLTAAALGDRDNPPINEEFAKGFRPAIEVAPDLVRRMRGQRGPQKAPTKRLVSLRLDPDVIEHFRATGPGWQARINDALRKSARLGKRTGRSKA